MDNIWLTSVHVNILYDIIYVLTASGNCETIDQSELRLTNDVMRSTNDNWTRVEQVEVTCTVSWYYFGDKVTFSVLMYVWELA